MKQFILSVRDAASGMFRHPAHVPSVGMHMRAFSDEVNRLAPDNLLYHHPEDFDLYDLGEFDDETGEYTCREPRVVMRGRDAVRGRELPPPTVYDKSVRAEEVVTGRGNGQIPRPVYGLRNT